MTDIKSKLCSACPTALARLADNYKKLVGSSADLCLTPSQSQILLFCVRSHSSWSQAEIMITALFQPSPPAQTPTITVLPSEKLHAKYISHAITFLPISTTTKARKLNFPDKSTLKIVAVFPLQTPQTVTCCAVSDVTVNGRIADVWLGLSCGLENCSACSCSFEHPCEACSAVCSAYSCVRSHLRAPPHRDVSRDLQRYDPPPPGIM